MKAMSARVTVAVVLLVALTMLAPLAQASPPDPLWIGGVFDAADQDDVVVLAASGDGATAVALDSPNHLARIRRVVAAAAAAAITRSAPPVFQGREPPIA